MEVLSLLKFSSCIGWEQQLSLSTLNSSEVQCMFIQFAMTVLNGKVIDFHYVVLWLRGCLG